MIRGLKEARGVTAVQSGIRLEEDASLIGCLKSSTSNGPAEHLVCPVNASVVNNSFLASSRTG